MPIYEYRCTACDACHEALQKLTDAPLVRCPHCGKDSLVRQVSAAGFRLKGGGWYETDFKSGQRRNVAAEASGSSAGAGTAAAKAAE